MRCRSWQSVLVSAVLFSFITNLLAGSMTSYQTVLRQLYKVNTFHPVKLGLENMHEINRMLGYPLKGKRIVHIAGTNGKGSVSVKLASAFEAVGLRTGLFTSPHISSFRERIQVNKDTLSEDDVTTILPELMRMCDHQRIPATFFELTTALAMVKFQQAQCDVVVLEAGIGGRLDATNIFAAPDLALSVITSVQLDHQKILGGTVEQIAVEKAGIMKRGCDVLVGPDCPLGTLKTEARRHDASLHVLADLLPDADSNQPDKDLLCRDIATASLMLLRQRGGVFARLPALPSAAATSQLRDALAARPPCRFEVFERLLPLHVGSSADQQRRARVHVVLDIAHNPAAVAALVEKVKHAYPNTPLRMVLGMSADKDIELCVPPLLSLVSGNIAMIHCTQAKHPRALSGSDLRRLLRSHAGTGAHSDSHGEEREREVSVREALRSALESSVGERGASLLERDSPQADAVVLVCGTAFIMAEARAELSVVEPKDGDLLDGGTSDVQELFGSAYTTPTLVV